VRERPEYGDAMEKTWNLPVNCRILVHHYRQYMPPALKF
jgi:hypothetical protein